MVELLSAAQMRAVEKAAIDSGKVTGLELMERAGRGVVEAIFEEWPELAGADGGAAPGAPGYLGKAESKRAVVLCGPGNNGGDGFVVARLLRYRGWRVEVFLYGDAEKLPPDARVNHDRWLAVEQIVRLGFPEITNKDIDRYEQAARNAAVIVDAIFGIGLTRGISGLAPLAAKSHSAVGADIPSIQARWIAVDLPSGIYADDPQPPGVLNCLAADLTVTFHCLKSAHTHPATAGSCGKVVVKDIGL